MQCGAWCNGKPNNRCYTADADAPAPKAAEMLSKNGGMLFAEPTTIEWL
ncbi:hypothetical protein FACS1894139_18390 [Planctomycetales bacterium]|nr:hypothetical protein FACS1894107_16420 [Planctomycetales bacterium]GHT01425.1 hypothetical protein FACS1894108_15130 [Planctomycetales bacterium]GHT08569.1 hypothetical protein FACS1894139_18390 [Planctomycetales bacterium]